MIATIIHGKSSKTMAEHHTKARLLPGSILHEAIVGALRANGDSFNAWCIRNGITPSVARNATFGQSRGPAGIALLARLIASADAEFVERVYRKRMAEHIAELEGASR